MNDEDNDPASSEMNPNGTDVESHHVNSLSSDHQHSYNHGEMMTPSDQEEARSNMERATGSDDDEGAFLSMVRNSSSRFSPLLSASTRSRRLFLLYRQHIMARRSSSTVRGRFPIQYDGGDETSSFDLSGRPQIRYWNPKDDAHGVVCRFCLESPSTSISIEKDKTTVTSQGGDLKRSHPSNEFVAPCACTGSAEYVHVECLRKWQSSNRWTQNKSKAAYFCQICTIPYALPPPEWKPLLLRRGTILVYLPKNNQYSSFMERPVPRNGATFDHTIVLLLQSQGSNPVGVILNQHLSNGTDMDDNDNPSTTYTASTTVRASSTFNSQVDIRRGGPVCGGRFGVTKFALAKVLQHPMEKSDNSEKSITTASEDKSSETLSFLDVSPFLSFYFCSFTDNSEEVEMLLRDKVDELVHQEHQQETKQQRYLQDPCYAHVPSKRNETKIAPTASNRFIAFQGYCKWSKNQLQSELLAGSWGIVRPDKTNQILKMLLYNKNSDIPTNEINNDDAESLYSASSVCPIWSRLVQRHNNEDGTADRRPSLSNWDDSEYLLSQDEWFYYPMPSTSSESATTLEGSAATATSDDESSNVMT